MLGARCAKPIPICYFPWTPQRPCRRGIIIPFLRVTKRKLREAELLGQGHTDGRLSSPNPNQDNDVVGGGLGAFRGRIISSSPFSPRPPNKYSA